MKNLTIKRKKRSQGVKLEKNTGYNEYTKRNTAYCQTELFLSLSTFNNIL